MSLGSFIRKQFIDVLQWTEDTDGVLAWRYPMEDQEIQYGGQLTVRETQVAIFVNEGKVADVFQPGLYKLETRTLPVLTYLKNWDKFFQSPFKSDVYFFSTRLQLGRRWGTAQPVTIRDREFGFVQLRAFGIYSYRIVDAAAFHREVSGTRAQYTVDDLEQQLRNLVVTAMSTTFGSADVPFVDMAANQTLLSQRVAEALVPVFTRYGSRSMRSRSKACRCRPSCRRRSTCGSARGWPAISAARRNTRPRRRSRWPRRTRAASRASARGSRPAR